MELLFPKWKFLNLFNKLDLDKFGLLETCLFLLLLLVKLGVNFELLLDFFLRKGESERVIFLLLTLSDLKVFEVLFIELLLLMLLLE